MLELNGCTQLPEERENVKELEKRLKELEEEEHIDRMQAELHAATAAYMMKGDMKKAAKASVAAAFCSPRSRSNSQESPRAGPIKVGGPTGPIKVIKGGQARQRSASAPSQADMSAADMAELRKLRVDTMRLREELRLREDSWEKTVHDLGRERGLSEELRRDSEELKEMLNHEHVSLEQTQWDLNERGDKMTLLYKEIDRLHLELSAAKAEVAEAKQRDMTGTNQLEILKASLTKANELGEQQQNSLDTAMAELAAKERLVAGAAKAGSLQLLQQANADLEAKIVDLKSEMASLLDERWPVSNAKHYRSIAEYNYPRMNPGLPTWNHGRRCRVGREEIELICHN